MSTCISQRGEYSSHEPNEHYVCTFCGVLDEDDLITELREVREERDALRVGVTDLINSVELVTRAGVSGVFSERIIAYALRALLDRTSITGE